MNRVVRAVLAWVMAIAMPLQGMAASSMLLCGPSHERMMQGLVLEAAGPGHAHGASHGMAPAGHDLHGQHGQGAANPQAGVGPTADHGLFSCSLCASCCAALALPASLALPAAAGPALPVGLSPATPLASRPPDGLDRPPRTVLA